MNLTLFNLISPLLVALGAFFTVRHFRLNRTYEFMARFNSPGFRETRIEVDKFLLPLKGRTFEQQCQSFRALLLSEKVEDVELRHHLWSLAMLFTELGHAKRSLQINPSAVKMFDRLVPCYWHMLRPYIREFNIRENFIRDHDDRPLEDVRVPLGAFRGFRYIYLWFNKNGAADRAPSPSAA